MYCEFYGFSESPFNVTPDPKFLFMTASHQEALASMIYGIKERKGFLSITGPVGTGKTTLIHHVLKHLDKKVKAVFIYQTRLTFKQLLKEIILELDLPIKGQDKSSILRQLNDYLIQGISRDENLALLIDEAQNLDKEVMEELRMFSNLETGSSKLVQIVFVGQSELESKLDSEDMKQLKQRIGIRRQIQPLTADETKLYMDHRLKLVGRKLADVFHNEAVSRVTEYSRGIPRTINIVCDNALLIGYSLSKKKIEVGIIEEVIRDLEGSPSANPSPGFTEKRVPIMEFPVEPYATEPVSPPAEAVTVGERPRKRYRYQVPFFMLLGVCVGLAGFVGADYLGKKKTGKEENAPSAQMTTIPSKPASVSTAESAISRDTPMLPVPQEVKAVPRDMDSASASVSIQEKQPTKQANQKTISVREGDTLINIVEEYYKKGNISLVELILDANPDITNPNLISIGQKIRLPEIQESALIMEFPDGIYKIYLGTFTDPDSADLYGHQPALSGKEIGVIPRKISSYEIWYRVIAGNFATREECLKTIHILKEKGLLPCFGGAPSAEEEG